MAPQESHLRVIEYIHFSRSVPATVELAGPEQTNRGLPSGLPNPVLQVGDPVLLADSDVGQLMLPTNCVLGVFLRRVADALVVSFPCTVALFPSPADGDGS